MNRLQSLPIILKKEEHIPRDVKYKSIENVYFPMNLKRMVTRKLEIKHSDVRILLPNESLRDMCLDYICEKAPVPEKSHLPKQKNKKSAIREKHFSYSKKTFRRSSGGRMRVLPAEVRIPSTSFLRSTVGM